MIKIRKAEERGHENHGWLDTNHTFSFASYYDSNYMGFRSLRVINEDRVAPGKGFSPHNHKNMEIISYVLEGSLEHKDSMGNQGVIGQGELQTITAGTGIKHSEYNYSSEEPVHFYQVWILPSEDGLSPGYQQISLDELENESPFCLVASGKGQGGSLKINQDVNIFIGKFEPSQKAIFNLSPNRHGWIQVVKGSVSLNNNTLMSGDGAAITNENALEFSSNSEGELMLFDLS